MKHRFKCKTHNYNTFREKNLWNLRLSRVLRLDIESTIHTFTDGHLGCFQHLAFVNCAVMNVGVHRFFWTGLSVNEWMKKLWYIYTMEYYAAERKKELLPFATAWMELESIMLSEISQAVKDKYHIILPVSVT